MAENKVVSTVVLDVTNSHQKVRINGVESESKLKNLEKEVKDKIISEMKESSYRESKAPRVELLNYVVIDDKGNKMSKEELKDRIEKKNLDNNQKDYYSINLSETNSVQISQTPSQLLQIPQLPQITTLSVGLNELTNKDKLISYWGKDINRFHEIQESVQIAQKLVLLERAKELGYCKDIIFAHIKVRGREHYGQADCIFFNRRNDTFFAEQDKFIGYDGCKPQQAITYEKIWYLYFTNETSSRIHISFGSQEGFDNFIKYIQEVKGILPPNLIIDNLSLLNNVDPNYDNDGFIKYVIEQYRYDLNEGNYVEAEKKYLSYFDSVEHKFEFKSEFNSDYNSNGSKMISEVIPKYDWTNLSEKTMDFKNYESFVTYESKVYKEFNDSWKFFNDKSVGNFVTVGEFRINMSLTAKNINNNIIEENFNE